VVANSTAALKRFRTLSVAGMSLPDYGFYILCLTAVVLLAGQAVIHPTDFFQIFILA
jgi:hypothetical protein